MQKLCRSSLVVLVVVFLSGCASYRPATMPSGTDPALSVEVQEKSFAEVQASPTKGDGEKVRVGNEVRIELIDGVRIEGEVLRLSEEEIVVGKVGNYGLEKISIRADEIAVLETRHESGGANIVAGGMAVIIVAFLATIALTVL